MFKQIVLNCMTKRIQYKINALSPCQLSSRYKVGITRNQNNLVNLFLIGKGCNIHAYLHINTLLLNR